MAFLAEEVENLPAGWEAKYLDCQNERYCYSLEFSRGGLTVNALIPEKYPEEHAVFGFEGSDWKDMQKDVQQGILRNIHELAKAYRGQPMLSALIEEAWNITRSKPSEIPVVQKQCVKPTQHMRKQKKTEASSDLHTSTKTPFNTPKAKQHGYSGTKKFSRRTEGQKLPSMKTAKDVINRLKWDDQLKDENFIVGYEDRFQGIIEVPVWSLNWEDDIAATGPDDKLAIPEHRIQHFKWNSEIVWERRTRTDFMFGSTGNGCDIVEFINRHKALTTKETQQCHEECPDEQVNAEVGQMSQFKIENHHTSCAFGNDDCAVNSTHSGNPNSVNTQPKIYSKSNENDVTLQGQTATENPDSTSVHDDVKLNTSSECPND